MIHDHEPLSLTGMPIFPGPASRESADIEVDSTSFEERNHPPVALVREYVQQLSEWRSTLPPALQWDDKERFRFSNIEPLTKLPHIKFFRLLQGHSPGDIDHNVDVAVAHLRTCFYQTQFLIHRPFVYKALHSPEKMTDIERGMCVTCVNAACLWPLSMAPPNDKKHLVPHLFSWTQHYLAMILVLRSCLEDGILSTICEDGEVSHQEIRDSISTMIRWLEDLKQVDCVAAWGLKVLEAGSC